MKVHTIEIAEAVEQELKKFLKDWGGGYPMRFTRFVDLGGKQTDLYVYSAEKGSSPWMVIRIKSVMKSEQGECIQIFVNIAGKANAMEEVLVSPEIWKLPALADRILTFAKNDMLVKISEGAGQIEGDSSTELPAGASSQSSEDEEDEYEDLDTSGILAGDGAGGDIGFNPEDVIAQANSGNDDEQVLDPSDLIQQMNDESEAADEEDEKS